MPPQAATNKSWLQTEKGNGLTMTILAPPLKKVVGLRRPYQMEVPTAVVAKLKKDLKAALKPYATPVLQCDLSDFKAVTYGARIDVFLLGYAPGLCGDPAAGITREQWDTITAQITALIQRALGAGETMYVEPWSAKIKFQARYETYVKYQEL